jgi:anti-anti-sigma factor
MEISTSTLNGRVPVTVLRLKGDLDASTSDSFMQAAKKALDDGATDFLVDLSGVSFISSAGIRALHGLYNTLHTGGASKEAVFHEINAGTYSAPHLKLLKPAKKVQDVLSMAGLDMYLKSYQDEKEALAAF